MSVSEGVRELFDALPREAKAFLGGPPFSADIEREVANWEAFRARGLPDRQRVSLGSFVYDDGMLVGYQSMTVLRDAAPTAYERTYLGLDGVLNYVQGKRIMVHPNWRGSGVAHSLLYQEVELARALGLRFVADVHAGNARAQKFLADYGFAMTREWRTRNGSLMHRMGC